MTSQILPYYVTANSSSGLYNLLETNLHDCQTVYVLTGPSTVLHEEILSRFQEEVLDTVPELECIYSSTHPDKLNGILIPSMKKAVLSENIVPKQLNNSSYKPETIDTSSIFQPISDSDKTYCKKCSELESASYENAYKNFEKAIKIHDEWEAVYISNMNFEAAEDYTKEIISMMIPLPLSKSEGYIKHRFFGGATYKGSVDFVQEITKNLSKRYFIKGRPGSGKSTIMKKIAAFGEQNGYNVEVYHCGFDPKSLDMVVIPALKCCIFDSTAPHEYFPDSERDEIVDVYAKLITAGTDEKYQAQLKDITSRYNALVQEGIIHLSKAKDYGDDFENTYMRYADKTKLPEILEKLKQQ